MVEEHKVIQDFEIDSAGTGNWHAGSSPDPRAVAAAMKRGYDFASLRARQFEANDWQNFDYILAMDYSNLRDLKRIQPISYQGELNLLGNYSSKAKSTDSVKNIVRDPYFGGDDGFEAMLDVIEDACKGLLNSLITRL